MKNVNLKTQLTYVFILITLIPIIILGLFQSLQIAEITKESNENQKYMTQRLAETVASYIDHHVNYVETLANSISNYGEIEHRQLYSQLKAAKLNMPGFENLYVGNEKGEALSFYPEISSDGKELKGENFSDRQYFEELNNNQKTVVSSVFQGRGGSNNPLVTIVSPISINSQLSGYVLGALDLSKLKKIIIDYDYGEGAYPVVLDKKDKVIYHPKYESMSTLEGFDSSKINGSALKGQDKIYVKEELSYQLVSYQKIPSYDWTVYNAKPYSFVRKSQFQALNVLIITLLVTVIIIQLIIRIFSNRINESIELLINYSDKIKQEDFQLSEIPKMRITGAANEFNLLLSRFHEMGQKIYRNREELKKWNATLEEKVSERTQGLIKKNSQLECINYLVSQSVPFRNLDLFIAEQMKRISELVAHSVSFIWTRESIQSMPFNKDLNIRNTYYMVDVIISNERIGYLRVELKEEEYLNRNDQEFLHFYSSSLAVVLQNDYLVRDFKKKHAVLKTAIESMNDGFVLLNQNYNITYYNKLFFDNLGINIDQDYKKNIKEVLQRANFEDEHIKNEICQEIDGGFTSSIFIIRTKGNQKKYLKMTKYIIEEDVIYGNGLVLQDITKDKEIEKIKNDLISMTSHEFKTPITTIRGCLETLLRKDVTWEEEFIDEMLQSMEEDVQRLEQLTNDWLDITKIEGNALALTKDQVNITTLIQDVLSSFIRPTYEHVNFIFENSNQNNTVLFIDKKRLEQVLINLITNAIRYNDHQKPRIIIRTRIEKDKNVIEVEDNGIGIAKEHISKVFDKFYQVDATSTRRRGGTGLGLAISKGVIEAHGGDLFVKSKLKMGSTFIIELPILEIEQKE